jgi:glycine cleavage system aminomethyltransferase T
VSRTIGFAYCPAGLAEGSPLEVDVFDARVPASIAADALVDPRGDRLRGLA